MTRAFWFPSRRVVVPSRRPGPGPSSSVTWTTPAARHALDDRESGVGGAPPHRPVGRVSATNVSARAHGRVGRDGRTGSEPIPRPCPRPRRTQLRPRWVIQAMNAGQGHDLVVAGNHERLPAVVIDVSEMVLLPRKLG